jgi:hypothetical protein
MDVSGHGPDSDWAWRVVVPFFEALGVLEQTLSRFDCPVALRLQCVAWMRHDGWEARWKIAMVADTLASRG